VSAAGDKVEEFPMLIPPTETAQSGTRNNQVSCELVILSLFVVEPNKVCEPDGHSMELQNNHGWHVIMISPDLVIPNDDGLSRDPE